MNYDVMSADSNLALPTTQEALAKASSIGGITPDSTTQQLLTVLNQLNQSGQLDSQNLKQISKAWDQYQGKYDCGSQPNPDAPQLPGTPSQPTDPKPTPPSGGSDPVVDNPKPTSPDGGSDPVVDNPPPASDSGSSPGTTPAPAPVLSGIGAGSVEAPKTSGPSYYVSPNGSDQNSGTSADSAFQSIQAAVDAADGKGGTIFLRGGTYDLKEAVKIDSSHGGTEDQHLVITNYNGEKPVLDGSGIPEGWFNGNITIDHGKYVDINGIETKDGNYGIQGWGANFVTVTNTISHNNWEAGIGFLSPEAGGESSDVVVSGNTVYNNLRQNNNHDRGWGSAIMISRTDNATVTKNNVYENQGEGIDFAIVDGFKATDNLSRDNFSVNLYMDNATNGTVERNTIESTGKTQYYRDLYGTQSPAYGILIANENYETSNPSGNITIKDNVARNNVVNFNAGAGLSNVTVDGNTFEGGTWDTVDFNGTDNSNFKFTNNKVIQTVAGKPVTDPTHVGKFTDGITFSGNTWKGEGASGLN